MKTLVWIAPLICLAGMAQADEHSAAPDSMSQAAPDASLSGTEPPHYRVRRGKKIRLPGGDLRSCLDLKHRAEIIRCSERGRRK
ncbi:MAG: hypothetical protein IV085_07170 [Thiobacillus sp.]|nr:hypothetical protein [Thiobacillus sp.]